MFDGRLRGKQQNEYLDSKICDALDETTVAKIC